MLLTISFSGLNGGGRKKKKVVLFIHQRSIKSHFQKVGGDENLKPLELHSKKKKKKKKRG